MKILSWIFTEMYFLLQLFIYMTVLTRLMSDIFFPTIIRSQSVLASLEIPTLQKQILSNQL